ncbi:Uncharacterized protein TCM_043241 [Theobroma cacao]|uniref:Disease resistance R13L4/SHOC-2-like LRR domain-containing protein n=1 Tax=Theobroma cacao TaxID=3641 RepID=A0A061FVC0_THECC|nr:Uncharacterized protein TCM_043241 [Theobroma cacao]
MSFGEKLDFSSKIPSVSLKTNKIRTFFRSLHFKENESSRDTIIRSFKCLRVLDLKFSTFEKVSHYICRLKHLRYLDLSWNNDIREVPNFVTRLHNLQTLDLNFCRSL